MTFIEIGWNIKSILKAQVKIMPDEKVATIGIKGFLLKPIVLKDLAKKIR